MRCHIARLFIVACAVVCSAFTGGGHVALVFAQSTHIVATPPGLGGLGTSVATSGNTTSITGGTRPGGGPNLFHSFNQFSVATGDVASFVNPGGVSNVITRVMAGGFQSNIFGTIQVLNANLFFINPNGIVFGPAAHLNVSGAAYFSTAAQVRLAGGGIFSATTPALDSTLSVGSPVTFGFLGPGPYNPIVLSSGGTLQGNTAIGLMGGTIQINGTKIIAQRVIVGSTASPGEISVQPTVGDPFSGASGNGEVQASAGTFLLATGGAGVPASVDILPSTITTPTGAQVNRIVNPSTNQVSQLTVVGSAGSSLPPLSFVTQTTTTPNFIDPVAFLNRAVVQIAQQPPSSPAPLLTSRCASRQDGQFSSFVQAPRDVTPTQPGVAIATPVLLQEVGTEAEMGTVPVQAASGRDSVISQTIGTWQGC